MRDTVKSLLLFMGTCFFMLLAFNPFTAEGEEKYSGTYTLEEIVVTGKQGGVNAVGTVREVTSEEIERKDAKTLEEALELVPGLQIRTGGDGVPRIDMRGFRSRHVLLLIDGIPINSTYDGNFDPTIVPVENIKKIRATWGSGSKLYGQGALGGTINIITKRGTKDFQGMINQEGGQNVDYSGRYSLSGSHKHVDFFLSGSVFKRDGFELSDDFDATSEENGNLRENSDKKRNNLFAKIGYVPSERWLLGITMSYLDGRYGVPGSTINNSLDPFAQKPKYERVDDYHGYSLQLSLNYDAPGPFEIKSWFYYNELDEETNRYDNNRYTTMGNTYNKGTFHQDTQTSITGLNLQTRCDLNRYGIFTLGFSGEWDDWKAEGKIRDRLVSLGGVSTIDESGGGGGGGGGGGSGGGSSLLKKNNMYYMRPLDDSRDLQIYSAVIGYEVSPLDRFGIVLEYSHHFLQKDDGSDDDEGGFLAGCWYDLFDTTRLRASAARNIRFPTIKQLYEVDKGNPDLKTERSYNYEVGVVQSLPAQTVFTLTGFYIEAEDYIEKIDPNPQFENYDYYQFQGFEITAETSCIKNLILTTSYSYLDTEDHSTTFKDDLQYRPRDKFVLKGNYTFHFGLSFYASVMYVNRQYYYSKNAPYKKRKLNEYTLVDMKISQKVYNNLAELYMGANNLFDKNYETSYGLPQAGRFVYGGIRINF